MDNVKLEQELKLRFAKINYLKRFEHTINVKNTAIDLVKHYNLDLDIDKVIKACLLHDYGKLYKAEELKEYVKKLPNQDIINYPNLYHSYVGYQLYLKDYQDEFDYELYQAIKYHTTGNINMNDLEKIIFIADYIEPTRLHDNASKARELAYINLDQCIEYILEKTIDHLNSIKEPIYPKTLEVYDYYRFINKRRK